MFKRLLKTRHTVVPEARLRDQRKQPVLELFQNLPWGDLWEDADMPSVIQYLLGTAARMARLLPCRAVKVPNPKPCVELAPS